MFKPRKRVLGHLLIALLFFSSGCFIGVVYSNGQNPTIDEEKGLSNFLWYNASQGVNAPQYYRNDENFTAWIEGLEGGGVTDHGDLTGLGDDDHSLYLLQDGSEELTGNWDVGNYGINASWVDLSSLYFDSENRTTLLSGQNVTGATAYIGFDSNLEYLPNYWLCDGVDDYVELQVAIDYVEDLGCGEIFLGVGDFDISATITAEPGIYIIGSGMTGTESGAITGCTTLVGANGVDMFEFNVGGVKTFGGGIRDLTILLDDATLGILVDNLCEFQVDNLHIRQGANNYDNAIEFRNASYYATIRNTFIHDFTVYGVRVLSNMVLLDSIWIEQNENGQALILIQGCSETRIVNSKLETHPPGLINHIEIEDGYRIVIANNKISGGYGHDTHGIYVSETGAGLSYEIIIEGNIFDREFGRHITFYEAGDYSVISDNTFKDGGGEDGNTAPIFHFRTVTVLVFSNNVLESGNVFATQGLLFENPSRTIIEGNYLHHNGDAPTILLSGTSAVVNIVGNILNCEASTWAIYVAETVTDVLIQDNNLLSGSISATGNIVRNNIGYVTENSGTTTLVSGQTSITVSHGCDYTPSAGDISVTAFESLGSSSYWFFDTITSSQFTIRVDINPGQDVDFAWSVDRH